MRGLRTVAAALAATTLLALTTLVVGASPAAAAARVAVANQVDRSATIDPRYTTALTLSGSGFQSIRKGHGGIYVLFAAVRGQWRPSQGGLTGRNYYAVPDSEAKNNGGFARFVAFPGSDTAGSANGGTISAAGRWSTTLNVPGATFESVDRNGKVAAIDCRKDTCGVLTIGAHGVVNGNNETFTPVRVADLYPGGQAPPAQEQTNPTGTQAPAVVTPASGGGAAAPVAPVVAGPPALEVDRASARPGRVLAFSATGLVPGSQVSATFEDGRAGAGPLTVGSNGQVSGLLALPADLSAGTYELRLVGEGDLPSIRFAVVGAALVAQDEDDVLPWVFAAGGAVALLAALVFSARRWRGARRA